MSLSFDLFWSFRSPYSYLATRRLVNLQRDHDVDVNVRVVLPIAVRTPDFFQQVNPLWPPYLLRDTLRIAQKEGIPYRWPTPDPIVQDFANRTIPVEQPHIWRLSRLGVAATERSCGLALLDEVSKVIWDGSVVSWHEQDHLAGAARRAGLDLAELDAAIEDKPEHYNEILEQNGEALTAAGHWGVPTMVFR
ncbi:MAG: DsbA family protein, partial [Proteobacteria bacterium]|nr:DsbA family protein [Pseudomonadota bacterium]